MAPRAQGQRRDSFHYPGCTIITFINYTYWGPVSYLYKDPTYARLLCHCMNLSLHKKNFIVVKSTQDLGLSGTHDP